MYQSTRIKGQTQNASSAIISGIAPNGGLYVPRLIPSVVESLEMLSKMNYKELATTILNYFLNDFDKKEVKDCVSKAYDNNFDKKEVVALTSLEQHAILELFHGPTLAFKDMALNILPHFMHYALKKNEVTDKVLILTATSGDTGKAALEGFKNVDRTDVLVYYPKAGVSQIQERQMITQEGDNTKVVSILGNFDDAQRSVKQIFNDIDFNTTLRLAGYRLSSANSINIGRLVPQIIYYYYAYLNRVNQNVIKLGDALNFVVPTGNFGNILAGYYAKQMGLPIKNLICASNENDVLTEFFNTGCYTLKRKFVNTISPSMDILLSSNLERLLFHATQGDIDFVNHAMTQLKNENFYKANAAFKKHTKCFYAYSSNGHQASSTIKKVYREHHYVMDPHTAIAYNAHLQYMRETSDKTSAVILSTASPYKFTRSVCQSLDIENKGLDDFALMTTLHRHTGMPIPIAITDLIQREIRHQQSVAVTEMRQPILDFIKRSS